MLGSSSDVAERDGSVDLAMSESADALSGLRRPKALRLWARLGVWGIMIGAAVPLLPVASLRSGLLWLIGSAGMVVGGLGAIGLGCTLFAERGARPAWRFSGVGLIPFGVSAVVLGASTLLARWGLRLTWGWFPGGLWGASIAFLTIGLVLSVLLGVDLVRLLARRFREAGPEGDSHPGLEPR